MENMIKQMRVKFSGLEETQEGETSHVRDRKLSSLRTRSFKEEGRRVQNRYRGQSSRELSYDYDSDYMESDEFRTAVAAAAFAIGSVEERKSERQRRDGGLSKPKRKQEDTAVSVTRRIKERIPSSSSSASNKMKNKEDDTVPISTPSLLSKKFSELQEKLPQRANSLANTEFKPEGGLGSSMSDKRPINQPTVSTSDVNRKRPELRPEDIKAEVWEKTEMERIKERYEKLNAKILEWENEKKAKAKKKLSRSQDNESQKKRARALQSYKNKTEMIDQIAEGARAQADENRRKDVIKVKKKADTIRQTGKIPTKTCLCC
ncbi:hypothetical protein SSX86_028811 [Deinandra increscens subsp. villosa]|uniref:Remorin C-terminal domain-containing protein n=1 Tax=Deinandra increscens subsp. villosa TaxID=3103831 RepID=A0AAP0GJM1_9ASTR